MEDSRGEPGGFWVEVAGVVARGPQGRQDIKHSLSHSQQLFNQVKSLTLTSALPIFHRFKSPKGSRGWSHFR